MKVLFAVNNDNISEEILKKYQKDYKEIISYKNVYYFNAILRELQKDKSYDRIVISEDLEPFANNNYDTIDKFLFEKLDRISDEATNEDGVGSEVLLICSDRRTKSDTMLVKLFSIGIYNAIMGQDRSIDEVCRLIKKPRNKKEAKQYYKIDAEKAKYESEDEESVSEMELQNILSYYKKIGKNEDKYVDSFNNIVSQYTDNQLKIIIKYLPINVKAVLEEKSPKYQELVLGNRIQQKEIKYSPKEVNTNFHAEEKVKVQMLKSQTKKDALQRPIVVPEGINKNIVKKLIKEEPKTEIDDKEEVLESPKRGRGRPKKTEQNLPETTKEINIVEQPKKGRGRPRKNNNIQDAIQEEKGEEDSSVELDGIDLFNINDDKFEELYENAEEKDNNINKQEEITQDEDTEQDEFDLFNMAEDDDNEEDFPKRDITEIKDKDEDEYEDEEDLFNVDEEEPNLVSNNIQTYDDFSKILTKDKKIVSFVGTTKNGTSFVVNNLAELLSSMGISTAILDMTKSKNAYYIYTNNEENLRKIASSSIPKLKSGIAEGVQANKNLSIFTDLPGENKDYNDIKNMLETLVRNFSVVLIDCDFDTPIDIFEKCQEIYLVQSMDVLTIQPLTSFLRNLKSKGVLKQEKIKIVINKEQKVKSLSAKTLIGGIAFYNDPAMSYMTELFDREKVQFCSIPFELQNYIKYLESLVNCSIKLNGYTKNFMMSLKELANMVYPLINKQEYSPRGSKYKNTFSNEMNDTLNKMKNTY